MSDVPERFFWVPAQKWVEDLSREELLEVISWLLREKKHEREMHESTMRLFTALAR